MPIYTYICKDCGVSFDLLMGVTSEKVERKCSKCGSKSVERTLGLFNVGNPSDRSSTGPSCPTGTCPTNF